MKDRRKFIRFGAGLDAFYELLGTDPVKNKAQLKDISKEGIKLSAERALLKGSFVDMEIEMPGENEDISAFAEVMWSKKANNSHYHTGMRFTKIQNPDKVRLLDYAYEVWVKTQKEKFATA